MSGLKLPALLRRRSAGALAVVALLAAQLVGSTPVDAREDRIVKSTSRVLGSDGKNYSITNHLTNAARNRDYDKPREWLIAWAGDAAAGTDGSPDPDFLAVIDATRGTRDYGKVVNTVTVDSIFGNEPHHMQYVWHKGDKIYAGGILTDTTYVFDVARLPEVRLSGIVLSTDTPCGSAPDAYTVLQDGTAYITQMGGPDVSGACQYSDGQVRIGNGFAGTPGEVVRATDRGKVLLEVPASLPVAESAGCISIPQIPTASCANPHGIAVREDLNRMVTSDLTEIRVMIRPSSPPPHEISRTTVRTWDIADRANPKLLTVSYLPDGVRAATDPYGIGQSNFMVMETAVTNKREHRGAFASTMSGGAVFYTPDITSANPVWREVFDDLTAFKKLYPTDTPYAGTDGGSWLAVSPDDKFLYHTVLQGGIGSPAAHAEAGLVYVLDIQKLLAAKNDTRCSIDTVEETSAGGVEADCPALVSVLPIVDETSGGPHWATMDNFELGLGGKYRESDKVTRLAVANYFVEATYIDGNHQVCMIDVDRQGKLSMDPTFKDEDQGTMCVEFNRTLWPHGEHGAARPHGVLFAIADQDIVD